jgi:hypothetical protein
MEVDGLVKDPHPTSPWKGEEETVDGARDLAAP